MRLIHRFLIAAALILSGLSAFAVEPIAVQRWSYKPRLEKPAAEGFRFALPAADLPAGTEVDFGISIGIRQGGPTDWVLEYRSGRKWKKAGSFTVNWYKKGDDTEWFTSFVLKKAVKDSLCVRVRPTSAADDPDAAAFLLSVPQYGAYLAAWPEGEYDRKRVLCIGNSFTFFGSSFFALAEIARSQGHSLQLGINTKGGQNFGQHLKLERSRMVISEGGYDVALMQNQSMSGAFYDSDSVKYAYLKDDAIKIADMVRKSSPKVRIILERTWAYPTKNKDWKGYGNAEAMDAALQNGTGILAAAMDAEISPIGNAFIKGRELGLPLYWGDSFHQNQLGSYLKSCVNYLLIFGQPFKGDVSSFGLDPEQAAACRAIAAQVVT